MSKNMYIKNAFEALMAEFENGIVESILFTTFNFSPEFFEKNVLPIAAGYSSEEAADITTEQINSKLASTNIAVIYDRSTNPEPKGNYRYGLLGTGPKDGFFHPKLILVIGKDASSKRVAKLLVLSANLTLSGWGINREVVGQCEIGKQQANALSPLIHWIDEKAEKQRLRLSTANHQTIEEGNTRAHLKGIASFLAEANAETETEHNPELFIKIPGTTKGKFLERISAGLSKENTQTTIVSPFWSEADSLNALFDYLNASSLILVPSINPDGQTKLPESIRKNKNQNYAQFNNSDRYTHAKSIEIIESKGKQTILIGSANFTKAAMGDETQGNVEAMLRYSLNGGNKLFKQINSLDESDINWAEKDESEEEAPAIAPFFAAANYDWLTHTLSCLLECTSAQFELIGKLNYANQQFSFTEHSENNYTIEIKIELAKPLYNFSIPYTITNVLNKQEKMNFKGLVGQWNAKDDELLYSPQPKLARIMDQLRALNPNKEPGRGGGFKLTSVAGDAPDAIDQEETFDFFSMFQAFFKLREYFEKNRKIDPFCTTSPNSLAIVFRAVQLDEPKNDSQIIKHFILLSELLETAITLKNNSLNKNENQNKLIRAIENAHNTYHQPFLSLVEKSKVLEQLIANTKHKKKAAKVVYDWFLEQLK